MKLCVSNDIHKSIPRAKFEADSSSGFGDMTSEHFPQNKAKDHQIWLFTPENRFPESSFLTKNYPPPPRHVNFSNFQAEEKFFVFKSFGTSQ